MKTDYKEQLDRSDPTEALLGSVLDQLEVADIPYMVCIGTENSQHTACSMDGMRIFQMIMTIFQQAPEIGNAVCQAWVDAAKAANQDEKIQ